MSTCAVLTNSLASNNQIAAHSGYVKTSKRLLENGLELYELRADTDAFRSGWSHGRDHRQPTRRIERRDLGGPRQCGQWRLW